MIDQLENASKVVLSIRTIWNACRSFFSKKGNSKKTIVLKNQKKIEEILPELERASKKLPKDNDSAVNEFLKDFDIYVDKEVYKIVPRSITNQITIPKIKSFRDIEASQEINIVPFSSAKSYGYYKKEPKQLPQNLNVNPNKFSCSFQSLLALSSSVKALMDINQKGQAYEIKRSIFEQYKEEGLRFCNCYSIGYVDVYLSHLKNKSETEIEEKMVELSKKPIFFISNPRLIYGRKEEVKKKIMKTKNNLMSSMDSKEFYIAIHGLGAASDIAESVSKNISDTEVDANYESIRIDRNKKIDSSRKIRDFSYIWYAGEEGKKFYNIFKVLFT